IDVAQANGLVHIAATTGNSSEQLVKRKYAMQDMAIIEMGDFAGAVFKHLKKVPIERVSICGGFGKITKLANGHLDLNSRVSSIDFPYLAALAQTLGADKRLQETIRAANTSIEAYSLCLNAGIDLAAAVCQQALVFARRHLPHTTALEILAINRKGELIASSTDSAAFRGAGL
nr:cobalt-precorrin-5B (C(1))-methyltransferase [Cellvibrionaceae bacterium]